MTYYQKPKQKASLNTALNRTLRQCERVARVKRDISLLESKAMLVRWERAEKRVRTF